MDWRKTGFAMTGAILLVVLCFSAGSEEAKAESKFYQYTGVIKARGEGTHILKVQTRDGIMNFHYQRHGKKQCTGFKELKVGDSVKITAGDNKPVSEAVCILKEPPDPASK